MNTPDKDNFTMNNIASIDQLELFAGILNKSEMAQMISERKEKDGTCFLVDFCDMEKIKENLGTDAATQILNQFVMRLKSVSRESDIIARIEECTFFIFMPIVLTKEEINHVVERLNHCIQDEMANSNIELFVHKGVEIAAVTSKDKKIHSLDAVAEYLADILEHHATDKVNDKNRSNQEEIFSRVFSMKANQLLTSDELTKTMQSMNNTYRGNFFIRLHDRSYVVLKDLVSDQENGVYSYTDAQKMLYANITLKVREEYKDNMLAFTNLDTLEERMKDTDSIKYEFQNILHIWCVSTFSVVERKNGKVTKVDFRISELTHDRAEAQELLQMQKEALAQLSSSELLFISMIDKKTGASRIIQSTRVLDENRIYDFDYSMKREALHLLPGIKRSFWKKFS